MTNFYLAHHGIKGQRWGIRRYQNKDGSLTSEGRRRYDRDVKENLSRKKDKRIDTSKPDPDRWVKEDIERSRNVLDANRDFVNQLSKVEKNAKHTKNPAPMDLSHMTDKELRDSVNRMLLERQYNNLYSEQNPQTVSKGRERVQDILEFSGSVIGVASSALGIALSIKNLKG